MTYTCPPDKVLVLRTCAADMTSWGEFTWPTEGHVEAPDWDPTPRCGGGLHGLLWGEGSGGYLDWSDDAVWLVVEVDADRVVDLGNKVKFPAGHVVYAGDRMAATAMIPAGRAVVGGTATAGYRGTATAGDGGTATAGDEGTATAGYRGTATAGDEGTATAGYMGTATAGDGGTATAGDGGTATAGDEGTIVIRRGDGVRSRLIVGYVGEAGIKANTPYRVVDARLVEVER